MRKTIIATPGAAVDKQQQWLDLEHSARVEITSEDPNHPIEAALTGAGGTGWRAAGPGKQSLRLLFDEPVSVKTVSLRFAEKGGARTQEFVLRLTQAGTDSPREIVRQQYNFNPPGTTTEEEEYRVNLSGVTELELEITPDISGSDARASLVLLRVA